MLFSALLQLAIFVCVQAIVYNEREEVPSKVLYIPSSMIPSYTKIAASQSVSDHDDESADLSEFLNGQDIKTTNIPVPVAVSTTEVIDGSLSSLVKTSTSLYTPSIISTSSTSASPSSSSSSSSVRRSNVIAGLSPVSTSSSSESISSASASSASVVSSAKSSKSSSASKSSMGAGSTLVAPSLLLTTLISLLL